MICKVKKKKAQTALSSIQLSMISKCPLSPFWCHEIFMHDFINVFAKQNKKLVNYNGPKASKQKMKQNKKTPIDRNVWSILP